MDFSKATILVTGGNSGIGKGLAETLAARGAKVIVTGRDSKTLQAVLDANPGMSGYTLDVSDAGSITDFATMVTERHPDLNAIIHNAGIMVVEKVLDTPFDLDIVERTIATNLFGPIRLSAALLPHLRSKAEAAIVTVSSGLAFVPRADTPTYSATKAAIHSWTQSMRHQLRNTSVSVIELAPPLVATNLTPGQAENPRAMPLEDFITESVDLLCQPETPDEVLVERVLRQRNAERTGTFDAVFEMINPA